MGFDLLVMEVVACTHQICESNCHKYGIFFVPSVFQRYCESRMEGHSCIRTTVLAEDVSSDGTVQIFKLRVSRGWQDEQEYLDEQEKAWNK
jgi:hypothetical protein